MNKLIFLFPVLLITYGCSNNSADLDIEQNTPTVSTNSTINITSVTAASGGNVTNDGGANIIARGVCWSTTSNPTINDNITNNGMDTGSFTSLITDLTSCTTYYVRAFATNSIGTAYGNELNFSTLSNSFFTGDILYIEGGTYSMGGNYFADSQPIHNVTLNSFNISKYEITNAQYATFMNEIGANGDGIFNGTHYLMINFSVCQIQYISGQFISKIGKENHPVILVSWEGAKAYCEHYCGRLPTEAEWEFASRGGNNSAGFELSGSNNADDVAWYSLNSGYSTHTVGTKNANEIGVYDMSGNILEWCNDWYDSNYYANSPTNNPQGATTGTGKVSRGGAYNNASGGCFVSARYFYNPIFSYGSVGFRPVFD